MFPNSSCFSYSFFLSIILLLFIFFLFLILFLCLTTSTLLSHTCSVIAKTPWDSLSLSIFYLSIPSWTLDGFFLPFTLLFFNFISLKYFLLLLYVCFSTFLSSVQIFFFQKIEYAIFLSLWFYFKILVARNKLFCSLIYDFILILYLSFAVGVSLLISNMKFCPIFCFHFFKL